VVFGTACAVMGIVLGRRFPIWGEKK
jgi:hypothetical protein